MKRVLEVNIGLVYLFLYVPILAVVAFSFNSGEQISVWQGFTFGWYAKLFENAALWRAVRNSLIVAGIATCIATVIGTTAALAIERHRFRFRTALVRSLYLPIIIPDIVLAIALLTFLCANPHLTRFNHCDYCARRFQYRLCDHCRTCAFTRL